MIGDVMTRGHRRIATVGLLVACLPGIGSCSDSVGPGGGNGNPGPAVALKFDQQPVSTFPNAVMAPAVLVSARDASGNLATGFTGSITLAIGANGGGGSLSGATTGVSGPSAEFNDLRIDGVGNGYTLVATSSGLSSATSSTFDVLEVAPAKGVIAFYNYGEGIVVARDDGGGAGIILVPAPSDGARLVTQPAWAPDGRTLAFTEYVGGPGPGSGRICTVNANGSGITRLGQEGSSSAWSPDGTRIAFVSWRDGNSHIYVMSARGSDVVRVTSDPPADDQPAWSPDGTKLAFTRSFGSESVIYTMNLDGSGMSRLQTGDFPAWSPDGTRIAFSRRVGSPSAGDIYVMNADGSGVARLTSNQSPGTSYDPTWSPDGLRIAFSNNADPDLEVSSIYAMNADGSGRTRVSRPSPGVSQSPAWSPQ